MNERHQFIAVDDEPSATARPGDDVSRMLRVVVAVICEWDQFIARGGGELPQRFSYTLSNPPSLFTLRALGGNPDHCRKERRGNLFLRELHDSGIVHEERIASIIRHGAHDALGPRTAHRCEEYLEDCDLTCTELRHCPNESRQGIGIKALK